MAQSALYRKLGRKEPTKGPARTLPPNARTDEARTVRAFGVFWERWSAHVEKVSRGVLDARDDARVDAKPPSKETLSLDFDRLFDQSGVERYLKGLTRKLADQNKGYIARVAKIPATQLATKDRTEGFIRENISLIKTLGDEQIAELLPILRKASAAGQRFEDTAGAIRERTGVGWSHAKLIARDQTTKLNAQLLQDNATKAGIEEYDWSTSLDEAVREDHRKLHGKRFRFDSPPIVNKRTGERRNPGGDIQCRCVALPVVSLLDDIGPMVRPGSDAPKKQAPSAEAKQETSKIVDEPKRKFRVMSDNLSNPGPSQQNGGTFASADRARATIARYERAHAERGWTHTVIRWVEQWTPDGWVRI